MKLDRRNVFALAASALAAPAIVTRASAAGPGAAVEAAVDRFARLPVTTSCLIVAGYPSARWQVSHDPAVRLFIGSAFKTFVLAEFLRNVEAGRLSEDMQSKIDDTVRSPSSPVFLNLSGTTPARNVLEAMITHSDNTATDVALATVGPSQVRALIAEAGLRETQIPESTRRFISYIAGAPEGVDIGWEGIQRMERGESFGPQSPALNDRQTMASTAEEMVRWYQQSLTGAFFKKPATLVEFKRIQAMANAISIAVPPDTVAYAKGGSIDWSNFHALSIAGQMIVSGVSISFCMTINWTGPDRGVAEMRQSFTVAVSDLLREAARAVA